MATRPNLYLPPALRAEVETRVRAGYPCETCGLLLGRRSDGRCEVSRVLSTRNLNQERSRDRYELDPRDYLAADRDARASGEEIVGVWHSHPEQNGRHERMHLTLKQATTKPPGGNLLQQQAKFEDFIHEYNYERPHQALDMKCPGDLYRPSERPYRGLPEVEYPFHDRTITVTQCGRICVGTKKINLSQVFAGQNVGIKDEEDNIWLVSFMQYDIGYFDLEACRVEPVENPFGPKVLTMSPV